ISLLPSPLGEKVLGKKTVTPWQSTITCTSLLFLQPLLSTTATLYFVLNRGLALGWGQLLQLNVLSGDHRYDLILDEYLPGSKTALPTEVEITPGNIIRGIGCTRMFLVAVSAHPLPFTATVFIWKEPASLYC